MCKEYWDCMRGEGIHYAIVGLSVFFQLEAMDQSKNSGWLTLQPVTQS